jgi:transcriptional regulator with XRE-family HTH domain
METLKEKLKRIRLEKKINQSEMANLINISRNAYVQIENGITKSISIENGKKISEVLKVPFTELFEIDNPALEKAKSEIKALNEENEKLYKQEDFFLEWTRMRRSLNRIVYNQLSSLLNQLNETSVNNLDEFKKSLSTIIKSIDDLEGFEQLEKELESKKTERLSKLQKKAN